MSHYSCVDCPYTTLFEAGAAKHSEDTGHVVGEDYNEWTDKMRMRK